MKKNSSHSIDPTRRSFLRAAGGAGVLGVLAANQAEAAPVALPASAPDAPASVGYHETEHIRQYYRTAAYW